MDNKFFNLFAPHNLRVTALTTFLALGMSACDVTDIPPSDALPESAAFENVERVNLAVAGMYDAAQSGFYDPLNGSAVAVRGYPFGSAATELDDIRGEDVVDMAGFFGIVYANTITASSPNVVNMWSTLYSLINQANVVIEGVNEASTSGLIPAMAAAAFEGEARFLRALANHELVINFAKPYSDGQGNSVGVPLHDFAINNIETLGRARTLDRGTVAAVYTNILQDLEFAEVNLPEEQVNGATRATKGAAIALKQRIYLHQRNWAAAKAEGDKLIAANFSSPIGGYTLAPTPRAAFPLDARTSVESIFSIENSADDNPGVNGSLPNFFGSQDINGRGLIAVSPGLYNAPFWLCNDLRRTEFLQETDLRFFIYKYTDVLNQTDYAPIIRYAEVLLNQAEAEARLGNDARALALLNTVRNRAVTTASDQYEGFAGSEQLIRAILNERRIELLGEGFRWDDIHRLATDPVFSTSGVPRKYLNAQATKANYVCGSPLTVTGSVAPISYNDSRFLWPIPDIELANNPNIVQNPGY